MSTILKSLPVRQELLAQRVHILTSLEFQRIFGVSKARAKYFLETYTKRGLFWRLKNDLYALRTDPPPEEEIANRLYRPSYLSFEYALGAHGLIPEMPYAITSATTKPTRTFTAAERLFEYSTIKRAAYGGFRSLERNGRTILIAEPEKAVVDYLYFVSLGKRPPNDRLRTHDLDWDRTMHYAAWYQRPGLDSLLQSARAAAYGWPTALTVDPNGVTGGSQR